MSENLTDELIKRLSAMSIHELRQLGRALGVSSPTSLVKATLVEEIMAIAVGKKDFASPSGRGAPTKSLAYDSQLAADVLKCREAFLAKSYDGKSADESTAPYEIFVASSCADALECTGGGILENENGNWFLRTTGCKKNLAKDVFVNARFVSSYKLREGDFIEGGFRRSSLDEMFGLASIAKLNGLQPSTTARAEFDALSPVYPNKKISVSDNSGTITSKIIDLFSPIGAGQRVLVVSPHGCGKTAILKDIALGIDKNCRNVKLVIVLIDVSAEDAADFTKTFCGADVFASPLEAGAIAHIRMVRLALEYCKRQTELNKNVVFVLDDMTKLVRALNSGNGRVGCEYSATDMAKRVLAAARNTEQGASLTVISALDTASGDWVEDIAYSALKDVCNCKITLSQSLARNRIYPPVNIAESYSMHDEKLLTPAQIKVAEKLRNKDIAEIFALLKSTDENGIPKD